MKKLTLMFQSMHQWIITLQEEYSIKYLKEMVLAGLLFIMIVGGVILHRLYVKAREERAFVALTEVVESYSRALNQAQEIDKVKNPEKFHVVWQDADVLAQDLYRDHADSYLAPFFLLIQSDIVLHRDGNVDLSREILEKALVDIPLKTSWGGLYHLKSIKMGLDSADAKVKEKALLDLEKLAADKTSVMSQQALFSLATYYTVHEQYQKAKNCLEILASQDETDALIPSIWVNLAKDRLGQMSASQLA